MGILPQLLDMGLFALAALVGVAGAMAVDGAAQSALSSSAVRRSCVASHTPTV